MEFLPATSDTGDSTSAPTTPTPDPRANTSPALGQAAGQIYTKLLGQGFTPIQSYALLGNMQQESGFSPGAINAKEGAYGLIQWRLDRRQALQNFADQHGVSPGDLNTQIAFLKQEFSTNPRYAGAWKDFQNATDLTSANAALKKYILYGDASQGNRLKFAQNFAQGRVPLGAGESGGTAVAGDGGAGGGVATGGGPTIGSRLAATVPLQTQQPQAPSWLQMLGGAIGGAGGLGGGSSGGSPQLDYSSDQVPIRTPAMGANIIQNADASPAPSATLAQRLASIGTLTEPQGSDFSFGGPSMASLGQGASTGFTGAPSPMTGVGAVSPAEMYPSSRYSRMA